MNKSDFIRQNAGNFLYIFIADDEVQYFNEAIRQKRLDQARYLQRVIVSWGYTQDDLIADLNAAAHDYGKILDEYEEMTPRITSVSPAPGGKPATDGDKVTIELSPYDLTRGRITWRGKA